MKTTRQTTISRTLNSLILAGLLTMVGVAPASAQNLIVNGDFTANAAGFTNWPGYLLTWSAGNPADITGWLDYTGTPMGLNGAATTASSVFGPTVPGGHTFAFLQGPGLLGQFLPLSSYTPSTMYKLEFDAAGRAGEANVVFAVQIGETGEHFSTGNLIANPDAFNHYSHTFTSPAVFDGGNGGPSLRLLLIDTGLGAVAVNYANVSLVALPLPARLSLLTDTYDTADSLDINAGLATRQSGVLAPITYTPAQSSASDLVEISTNALKFTRLDNTGTHSMLAAPVQNFFDYEVNSSFRLECDINIQSALDWASWAGISLRGASVGMVVAQADCFSLYVRSDGGHEVFDGAPPNIAAGGGGTLNGQTNFHVVIDVSTNVVRITINGMAMPFNNGTYSHVIANANAGNHVNFVGFATADAAPTTITFDNVVFSVLPPTTPAPTLLNPAYDTGTSMASFQFNSVAEGIYVLESKVNLSDPAWTKMSTIAGTGGLQNVSVASPSASGFFRLRVPLP
jgi:hypothetical protein